MLKISSTLQGWQAESELQYSQSKQGRKECEMSQCVHRQRLRSDGCKRSAS